MCACSFFGAIFSFNRKKENMDNIGNIKATQENDKLI